MKSITSKDPRKKQIMELFKKEFSCTKVTCVQEDNDFYHAHCLVKNKDGWDSIGDKKISKEQK